MNTEERGAGSSDFGTLLRFHRREAGLSQEALAERARLSTEGISALERGFRRTPRPGTLALLADALALQGENRRRFEEAAARWVLLVRKKDGADGIASSRDIGPRNPVSLTAFVGRAIELEEIVRLLRADRIVTLTGAGGIGKTRTALEAARKLGLPEEQICFVTLAPLSDPSLVGATIAAALRLQPVPGRPLIETLVDSLKHKTLLFIFDNCEHVIAETARVVEAVLLRCSQVRILITSRAPLKLERERRYRLPSLTLEDATGLFRDRAQAVDHTFTLDGENTHIVAELCRRLDGIPLAIELAAARVNVLSLGALTQMLDDRFRVLSGGTRTAVARQQTMRAAIDWSYNLLAPQEQLLFVRLGAFSGSFDLNAATAVCGDDDLHKPDIFNLIELLTDKSLVVADVSSHQGRYRLFESTAAYALDALSASAEGVRVARRHAEYFRGQAETADEQFGSGAMTAWLGSELDIDNYRRALDWTLGKGNDPELGGAITVALSHLWFYAGLPLEGRYWVEHALPRIRPVDHPAIAARLQFAVGVFSEGMRKKEAAEHAARLYKVAGDLRGVARAEALHGLALLQMGQLDRAGAVTAQALRGLCAHGDTRNATNCLGLLALLAARRGDFRTGRELFEQALLNWKTIGDDFAAAGVLSDMAELEFAAGDAERALRLTNEAAEIAAQTKNLIFNAGWHVNAAAYQAALGDLGAARDSARKGLCIARELQNAQHTIVALQHLALLAALDGNPRLGAHLLGYVDAQYERSGMQREYTEQWGYDTLSTVLRETFRDDEIAKLGAEGAAMTENGVVALAAPNCAGNVRSADGSPAS